MKGIDRRYWGLICESAFRCYCCLSFIILLKGGVGSRSRFAESPPPPLLLLVVLSFYHTGPCSAPDNSTFTSCGQEKDFYLWDVPTGHILRKFSGHYGRINTVRFSGSTNTGQRHSGSSVILSGSFDSKVMIWDVRSQSRAPIQTLQEGRDSVTSIECSEGNVGEVVVGYVDGTVRTYDLRMGKKVEDVIAGESTAPLLFFFFSG
jgi:WD40 repeat protein